MTYYWHIESPLGRMLLTASERGLSGAYFVDQKYFKAVAPDWVEDRNQEFIATAQRQFAEYFDKRRKRFEVCMDLRGTPFQRRVWRALESIPFGSTTTYGELARRIDRASAVRAVGAAVGRNPAGIIVPCHRVIGADGSLTGYAGGMDRKAALLRLEGAMRSKSAEQEQLEIENLCAR